MPNQRKKSKAMIGGYVAKDIADKFKAIAKARKMSAKDLLEILVKAEIAKGEKPNG